MLNVIWQLHWSIVHFNAEFRALVYFSGCSRFEDWPRTTVRMWISRNILKFSDEGCIYYKVTGPKRTIPHWIYTFPLTVTRHTGSLVGGITDLENCTDWFAMCSLPPFVSLLYLLQALICFWQRIDYRYKCNTVVIFARGIVVRLWHGARNVSLLLNVQTIYWVHPASN